MPICQMPVFLGVDAEEELGRSFSSMKLKDGRKIKLPENMIISKFALKDLNQGGRKLMKDQNITAVRHRSKMCEWSEHELLSNSLYLSMTKVMSGDGPVSGPHVVSRHSSKLNACTHTLFSRSLLRLSFKSSNT
jgi:hypothetical protein